MAKDLTKFKIKGTDTWLPKNRLVLSCLDQFFKDMIIEDAGVGDYNYLKRTWPDEIQGGAGIIVVLEEVTNERYYFMDNVLEAPDGKKYVVCNQWGASNFEKFIELAITMGYPIVNNQTEDTSTSQAIENTSSEAKTQKLQIEITGLIQQILQGTCEDSEDTDFLEENPYDGIHTNFYKFDSDNTIKITLDDTVILEQELKAFDFKGCINSDSFISLEWDNEANGVIYNQLLENSKFQTTNENDESCLYIHPDSEIFLLEGKADTSKHSTLDIMDFKNNDIKERYSLIDYGWYHLKTYPIEVTNFSINQLIFISDTNVIDFTGSSDSEIYYAFTNLYYINGKQIEFEIIENRSKSLDVIQGWVQDV